MDNSPEKPPIIEREALVEGKSVDAEGEEESVEDLAEKRIFQIEESARELKAEGDERMEHANDTIHLPQEKVDEIEANITPGATKFNIQTGEVIGLEGKVDLQADARELPFGDNKLGAVFCSCLGELHSAPGTVMLDKNQLERKLKLRMDALKEIFRALKPEGILVWQGGTEDDVKFAQEIGFKVDQYETSNIATLYQNKERPSFNVVFEKERIANKQESEQT